MSTSRIPSASPSAQAFPWAGLFTLSALIFTSVTSEWLPTGLLPEIAAELSVSESQVGLLITIFAATVVISTAPLAALTRNQPRKKLVIIVLIVFVIGNLLAAVAPNYAVLVIARIIGGLSHGLFWAVVGAYSAHLVPPHQVGRAVAVTSAGATAAFVLGVPVGTALGHALGWRLAFVVIAIIIAALTIMVVRILPPVNHQHPLATGEISIPLRKDRSVPGVIYVCILVALAMLGHNLFYTYIVPYLIGPAGIDSGAVAGVLLIFGAAGAVGLALAGMLVDRFPRSIIPVTVALVAICAALLGMFPAEPAIMFTVIVVWGIAFGGVPAMMQTRLLQLASPRMRDVGSAYLTTSFNVGIGGGALVGGILLDEYGVISLPYVDAGILGVAVVFAIVGGELLRRRDARSAAIRRQQPTPPAP
ncbi:MFS transporter [Salinibacterium sp. SWN1162]|uniref:MFS transporter n=1 Tax=Salinibacterium sp. SWN1162 TaxID=2792053 RepID=UPI0018CC9ACE|nr:MFS transporter [Salinibacterium sp. SWN1162]MBH0008568.1 MFS transporter [Salinibacterium sp. SWN1162]